MSNQNFWSYNGNVQPLQCDVKNWFFSVLKAGGAGRLFGSANPRFAEMWWDWPDENSTDGENNRYIAMNYTTQPGYWLLGKRARTAGDRIGTLDFPVLGGASTSGGALYQHESGYTDDGAPRASAGEVFLETGALNGGEGNNRFHVKQVVFDATANPTLPAPFGFRFFAREEPWDSVETDTGLYTEVHNGLMDTRFSGRSVRMRLEAILDGPFTVGRPRLQMRQGGSR
jgi:hypothetical protein